MVLMGHQPHRHHQPAGSEPRWLPIQQQHTGQGPHSDGVRRERTRPQHVLRRRGRLVVRRPVRRGQEHPDLCELDQEGQARTSSMSRRPDRRGGLKFKSDYFPMERFCETQHDRPHPGQHPNPGRTRRPDRPRQRPPKWRTREEDTLMDGERVPVVVLDPGHGRHGKDRRVVVQQRRRPRRHAGRRMWRWTSPTVRRGCCRGSAPHHPDADHRRQPPPSPNRRPSHGPTTRMSSCLST